MKLKQKTTIKYVNFQFEAKQLECFETYLLTSATQFLGFRQYRGGSEQRSEKTFLYFSGEAATVRERNILFYDSGQTIGMEEGGRWICWVGYWFLGQTGYWKLDLEKV